MEDSDHHNCHDYWDAEAEAKLAVVEYPTVVYATAAKLAVGQSTARFQIQTAASNPD